VQLLWGDGALPVGLHAWSAVWNITTVCEVEGRYGKSYGLGLVALQSLAIPYNRKFAGSARLFGRTAQ